MGSTEIMKLFSTLSLLAASSFAQDYDYAYESDLPGVTGRQQEESSGAGPTADEPATTTTPTTEMAEEPLYVDPDALAGEVEEEVDPASFQPRAMLMDVGRRENQEVQERFTMEDAEDRGKKKKQNQYNNKPYQNPGYKPEPSYGNSGYQPNRPGYNPPNPGYQPEEPGYGSNPGYDNKPGYGGESYDKPEYGKPEYGNNNNYGHQYGNGPGHPKDPYHKDPYVTIEPYTTEYYKNDLKCFHCDAPSFLWCYQLGKVGTCGRGEVCMTEIRQRNGRVEGVCMGCKAKDACLRQKKNNFYNPPQCRPKAYYGDSVCRQCCNTAYCSNNFNPKTKEGWEKDMLYKNY